MIRFSVFYPCFNPDIEQLRHAVAMTAAQIDVHRHQVVILDDASADPSVCRAVADEFGVQLFRSDEEMGGLATHNHAFGMADGDLAQIVHPDDATLLGYYRAVAAAAEAHPGRALYVTNHLECDEHLRPYAAPKPDWLLPDGGWWPLHNGNPLAVAATCCSRAFIQRHGWHKDLGHCADWLAAIRATMTGGAVRVNYPLALYRHHPASHTSRIQRTGDNLREFLRVAELAEEFMSVDHAAFRAYVLGRARRQAETFRRNGDAEAEAANRGLVAELEAMV